MGPPTLKKGREQVRELSLGDLERFLGKERELDIEPAESVISCTHHHNKAEGGPGNEHVLGPTRNSARSAFVMEQTPWHAESKVRE